MGRGGARGPENKSSAGDLLVSRGACVALQGEPVCVCVCGARKSLGAGAKSHWGSACVSERGVLTPGVIPCYRSSLPSSAIPPPPPLSGQLRGMGGHPRHRGLHDQEAAAHAGGGPEGGGAAFLLLDGWQAAKRPYVCMPCGPRGELSFVPVLRAVLNPCAIHHGQSLAAKD